MSWFQALVLGVLQGLGEFLPISSSGHLIVAPWLLGWPVQSLSFDVALHVGTLAAVLWAFRRDWWTILGRTWQGARRGAPFAEPEGRLLGLLALGSVPAAVAGLFLEDWAETVFRSPALVGVTMALMGLVLYLADRRAEHAAPPRAVTLRDAVLIGCAQALALVPGVSRSGATITMGLFLGFRREEAARFSFLLATPITFGAALLKVPHLFEGAELAPVVIGMVAAAVVGFLSIRVLLTYVRTRTYRPFVAYRLAFAALVALVLLVRE
ncbi:MAG TPA: undecaprenyl-diphosphate phosphatase [Vicinamibacteria bacterium]|nr:undecaprenyl-diphosphate phosphatase [Vicinamibacteria bacterium]